MTGKITICGLKAGDEAREMSTLPTLLTEYGTLPLPNHKLSI